MSASLVGSEMCIRDRNVCPALGVGESRQLLQLRLWAPGRSAAPPARAVSYTHLTLPTICSV
eukprot:1176716-Alexandrium_andersonii.AAC.1